MNNVLVSIWCITYNHEKYIRDAIEGFLMQQTSFNYEVIIADDCSTDNTDAIIKEYIQKHPKGNIIKYFRHEKNIGMMPNFVFALRQCTGKYIALCEGDDYWTDPLKLQKQVDFLEANPEFAICYHKVKVLKDGIFVDDFITSDEVPDEADFNDLLKQNFMHTPSVVFRNNIDIELFEKATNVGLGDYFLHLYNAHFGKIKRLNEYMAIYRYGVGIWSSAKDEKYRAKKILSTYKYAAELLKNFDLLQDYYLMLFNYTRRKLVDESIIANKLEKQIVNAYSVDTLADTVTTNTIFKVLLKKIRRKLWKAK